MDYSKLEGITSAIEAEAKQPQPSHANLARLVGMYSRELIEQLGSAIAPQFSPTVIGPINVTAAVQPESIKLEVIPASESSSEGKDSTETDLKDQA